MIERFSSGSGWERAYGYSRVVTAGPIVHVAGTTASVDGVVQHVGDAYGQTMFAFRFALDMLAQTGATIEQVVRTRMYVVGGENADAVGRAHGEVFGAIRPASTLVMIAGLILPEHLVEVELEAYRG